MLVSVIIPAYNAEATLAEAIKCVQHQTASDLELLLVDNNSDDGTAKIIKNAAEDDTGRIRALSCPIQGVSATRNVGLHQAKGQWIQLLDADDTIAPSKISLQLENISVDIQWVIGGYRVVSPGKEDVDNIPHEDPWKGLVYGYRIGCTHANLYQKAALEAIGGWDESLPDNTDPNLHFELLKSGLAYQIVPEVLSSYHQHPSPNRLSTKAPIAGNLRRIDLLERINDYLSEQRPEYWSNNREYFIAALLRVLRILATHNLKEAAAQLQRLQKTGKVFFNLPNQPILSQKILYAYRMGGFKNVERLRLLATKVFPRKLKEWLKQ